MKKIAWIIASVAVATLVGGAVIAEQAEGAKMSAAAARGKYLVQITGCNDCHTAGYAATGGKVDESLWLAGDQLGWRGPWGTTYAPNLRLTAKDMSAEQFTAFARSELRPPMPWFNLRAMSDRDVEAIYAYLKFLGPAGEPAPAYVPPDQTPAGPYVQFPGPPG